MYATTSATRGSAADSAFPAGATIVALGFNYIRLSAPALTSGSGRVYAGDIVTVNGTDYYAWYSSLLSGPPWQGTNVLDRRFGIGDPEGSVPPIDNFTLGGFNVGLTVQNLCQAINETHFSAGALGNIFPYATPIGDTWDARPLTIVTATGLRTDPGTLATSFLLETDYKTPITVTCSCVGAFTPQTPQTSENPATPHRVYFSDLDEPESVPILNYFDVGTPGQPILALVPLRNALLVFKADGVWRITGSGPAAWSVEALDSTLRLVRPEAVSVLRNKAYAWCVGGFYEITDTGSRSLTAGRLDVELRGLAAYAASAGIHATFVVTSLQRNLVLLGVPLSPVQNKVQRTTKIYAFHTVTEQWSEWPVAWGHAAESVNDTLYYSRPESNADGSGELGAVDVEVRSMQSTYNGIDRTYALGPSLVVPVSGGFGGGAGPPPPVIFTINASDVGSWIPTPGDWISGSNGVSRAYRRITAAALGAGVWTLTLEAVVPSTSSLIITDAGVFFITDGGAHFLIPDLSVWQGHEAITLKLEWHPTSPAGIPIGTLARELQFQMDLRDAPNPATVDTLPRYIAGGTSDRSTFATVTSSMARIAQIQPLRVGVSRQIARSASMAPYLETSDLYPIRVVGGSVVFEGTSEKTRR